MTKNNKELDSVYLYVRSLTEDLRKLNERFAFFMSNCEIQNVVNQSTTRKTMRLEHLQPILWH